MEERSKGRRRRLKFSPAWIDAVKPEARVVEYRDTEQRGLILRVEASGLKTWWARYTLAGRDGRYRIGTFPETALKAARTRCQGTLALAQAGVDPQAERERLRVGTGVFAAIEAWLDDAKQGPLSRWKGGLEGGAARSFLPHIRRFRDDFASKKLVEIGSKDIERFISHGEAAATRNRALTALRGLFWWAGRKGLIETDPSAGLGKEREAARSRTLGDAELRALITGFDATRYGRAVRLLALTGLRRDEVLGAKWSWLDSDVGILTIPPEAEKTGRSRGEPRRVALSAAAAALLAEQREALFGEGTYDRDGFRDGFIFATTTGERPHPDVLKPRLYALRGRRSNGQPASKDKRAKPRPAVLPADVTIHDVRRTVADALLNRLGAAPWVVDHVVLGHARPKLLRTYMPTLPLDEARAALTRWAELLDGIVAEKAESANRSL